MLFGLAALAAAVVTASTNPASGTVSLTLAVGAAASVTGLARAFRHGTDSPVSEE